MTGRAVCHNCLGLAFVAAVLIGAVTITTAAADQPPLHPSDTQPAEQATVGLVPPVSQVQNGSGRLVVTGRVTILLPAVDDAVTSYAARCLGEELNRLFGLQTVTVRQPHRISDDEICAIISDQSSSSSPLENMFCSLPVPKADGYLLGVRPDEKRAVVHGFGGNGVIRGVFALAGLLSADGGEATWPEVLISDTPDIPIRFTRDIFLNKQATAEMTQEQALICELDWWARWGLNHALIPSGLTKGQEEQDRLVRWYVEEAHRRGMKAGANPGGRSLCPSNPAEMESYLSRVRHLLGLGCDFLLILFDDLPRARLGGHCDRCVRAFGGSLAAEQRHILESVCNLLPTTRSDLPLFWCPTYYSLGMTGYIGGPEGPDEYFTDLGGSARVCRAFMFHCAFDHEFNAYLDGKGLKNRIWWYNGIRTDYYMVSRAFDSCDMWGPPLRIPGLKDFQSFFSRFENGWLMPSFAPTDRSLHPCVAPLVTAGRDEGGRTIIPKASLDELAYLGERMQGLYLCSATAPYHIALAGVFAAHPSRFDQQLARAAIADAMFSPGASPHVLAWQTAYARAQMVLARKQGCPLTPEGNAEIIALTGEMESGEKALRDCLARRKSALPASVAAALLDEMIAWRLKVLSLAAPYPPARPP
ncbi:MAG TPA: glycoside hydrolase family 20 zincin-like fold domain-containing protein [Phycisphaerae bacterium]|nr:glycoside hydrolase family 20 zincin-like fold domain-containing protein [Phycisphaerae bacterium]